MTNPSVTPLHCRPVTSHDWQPRHVKMVLTGDGGDEVLSGYPAYQVEKLAGSYQRIPRPVRALAEAALGWCRRPEPRTSALSRQSLPPTAGNYRSTL